MPDTIYTIGHSNHTWESFGALLRAHAIDILVDTRSNPVSRFAPFSNSRTLPGLLERENIEYVYLGGPLGGKPTDESLYDDKDRPDYRRMRSEEPFQEAVDQVASMARRSNVVLMCSTVSPNFLRDNAAPPQPELLEITSAKRWSCAPAHKAVLPRREWPISATRR